MTILTPTSVGLGPAAGDISPAARLARLLDPGSMTFLHRPDDSGAQGVSGLIDGRRVFAYCTDATRMGGALGAAGAGHIVGAIESAGRLRCPVVGLWHSGGAKLAEGVESLDGVGRMFAAMTRASGVVPQISVILGPAAGAAAYGPALTDLIIMCEAGRMFVTGPDVVQKVTGARIGMAELGGPSAHGAKSGTVHVTVGSEDDALACARRMAGFFTDVGRNGHGGQVGDVGQSGQAGQVGGTEQSGSRSPGHEPNLRALLPKQSQGAYDVRPLIHALLDDGPGIPGGANGSGGSGFLELQPHWAANIVIGFGRLDDRPVGVIANNPLSKGGCLDALASEKAARFVRMCDALGVALIVLADVPGYLPGVDQEWGGVIRRGAKLLHAFAEAVVPRVTLITRKSYGGAYLAMNSRALGATAVFAWPDAEVAVMGAEAAVGILHRKKLADAHDHERPALLARLTDEHQRLSGGVTRALALGVVDEVIAPETTRQRLAHALATAPRGRGRHGNVPL